MVASLQAAILTLSNPYWINTQDNTGTEDSKQKQGLFI